MAMTKEQFQARAKNLAQMVKDKPSREADFKHVEENRSAHLVDIKQFDPAAAEIERKYFDADNAASAAELAMGEYYASKIEQK